MYVVTGFRIKWVNFIENIRVFAGNMKTVRYNEVSLKEGSTAILISNRIFSTITLRNVCDE